MAHSRFWRHVRVGDSNQCWPWLASTGSSGYGVVRVNKVLTGAHRRAYELERGLIPSGVEVCHSCDNKLCVNPAHLFLGTKADNMLDMYRKKRHPSLKIEANQAKDILRRLEAGESQQNIAGDYGISQVHVSRLKLGRVKRFDKEGLPPLQLNSQSR